jgi:hypothetical protein
MPVRLPILRTVDWITDWRGLAELEADPQSVAVVGGTVAAGSYEAGHWSVADGAGEKLNTPFGDSMFAGDCATGRSVSVAASSGSGIAKYGVSPVDSLRSADVHMGTMLGKPFAAGTVETLEAAEESISRKAVGDGIASMRPSAPIAAAVQRASVCGVAAVTGAVLAAAAAAVFFAS